MEPQDRRLPSNVPLREAIDQVRATCQHLKEVTDGLAQQTVVMARQGQLHHLPNPGLQQTELARLLTEQQEAVKRIRLRVLGATSSKTSHAPLISDEEMAALMAPRSDITDL